MKRGVLSSGDGPPSTYGEFAGPLETGRLVRETTKALLLTVALLVVGSPAAASLTFQKISATQGSFTGDLDSWDKFGSDVAALGDVDGDGVGDIAVGANGDDDGGAQRGAVWILFLNTDGSVKSHQKISATVGSFTGALSNGDAFGTAVAGVGDLDGDTVPDLAVGAYLDDDGCSDCGAIWMLFLNTDGTVKSHQKVSALDGGFTGTLDASDGLGITVASLGDLDGDTVVDLAVGALSDDDGGTDRGAVWILFLNTNGTVKAHQKISDTDGGFAGTLMDGDRFGISVDTIGDLDGDTVSDLAVGADNDDDGSNAAGAVWILFLNPDGTVKSSAKVSATSGGFAGPLDDSDVFGRTLAAPGDLDGDSVPDLAVGAMLDDDGGPDRGAVWVLHMNADGSVKSRFKISNTLGGFAGTLNDDDRFSIGLGPIGDLDGDGETDLAIGAIYDDDGSKNQGAVHITFAVRDLVGPHVTTNARQPPVDLRTTTLDSLDVTFDEPIGSLTPSDVSIDGPGGSIVAASVVPLAGNTYTISFAQQTAVGTYSVTIAPTVTDVAGNGVDQDRDGVNAEPVDDAFEITFAAVDVDAILTTATSIPDGNTTYDNQEIYVEGATVTIDGSHSFTSLHVGPNGIITHTAGQSGFDVTAVGDITVDVDGAIDANGKGFSGAVGQPSGPGAGVRTENYQHQGAGGAGYGGKGAHGAYSTAEGGPAYGSITQPIDLGSGGGADKEFSGNDSGGSGGGALRLSAGGVFSLNGSLQANGNPGIGDSGGGSGGSIYVSASQLTGTGTISADGGAVPDAGGSGGGGRVALYFDSNTFTGSITAYSGGGNRIGGAGTIYTKLSSQTHGDLSADNNGNYGETTPLLLPAYSFDSLNLSGDAELEVPAGTVLNWVDTNLALSNAGRMLVAGTVAPISQSTFDQINVQSGGSLTLSDTASITGDTLLLPGGAVTVKDDATLAITSPSGLLLEGTMTLADNSDLVVQDIEISTGTLVLDSAQTFDNLDIGPTGTLTHSPNQLGFDLTITGDLTVDLGGAITADGMGYPSHTGPGAGASTQYTPSGASYGGLGGSGTYGPGGTYCPSAQPVELGSGGGRHCCDTGPDVPGGPGGGALRIEVNGTLQLDGSLTANGGDGLSISSDEGGGGSGGTVHLTATTLAGTGSITAHGGDSLGNASGGGGGRIFLSYGSLSPSISLAATGGTGTNNGEDGTIDHLDPPLGLQLNKQTIGNLGMSCDIETREFSAIAGQQLSLLQVNSSLPGVAFDLVGPNGYRGFTGIQGASALYNLPETGQYTLVARDTAEEPSNTYSFYLQQSLVTDVVADGNFVGSIVGDGQAQLFKMNLTGATPSRISLQGIGAGNAVEVYARLGSPPTRGDYDHHFEIPATGDPTVLIPMAAEGDWYILVYAELVGSPGAFTLVTETADVFAKSFSPGRHSSVIDTVMTIEGAGFDASTQVVLDDGAGNVYPASTIDVYSPVALSATFTANTVPMGTYSVIVSKSGGGSEQFDGSFVMVQAFGANLVTRLLLPSQLGYHAVATIWVEYSNTGDVAMPAPLVVLRADQNGREAAIMRLGATVPARGFWTDATPVGFTNTIQFLGSGRTPGLLQPGESIQVPIQWAGWEKPWFEANKFDFTLGAVDDSNSMVVDWTSEKAALRPDSITTEAWDVVWTNFLAQIGTTWGDYVGALSDNAAYLARLGVDENDLGVLLGFELDQANSIGPMGALGVATDALVPAPGFGIRFEREFEDSISGRYRTGTLGRGWSHNWEQETSVETDGTVTVVGPGTTRRIFQPDSRPGGGYFAMEGDFGSLTALGGGAFRVTEADGTSTAFRTDGLLDYVEDTNGNRVTATYTGGLLTLLTHSAGQTLSITYTAGGLIETLTDPDSRVTSFSYHPGDEHLETVTYFDATALTYQYMTGGTPQQEHALTEIELPGSRHQFYTYDSQGRVISTYRDSGAETISFGYADAGLVSIQNADGKTWSTYRDHFGQILKIVDPAGNETRASYDEDFNLIALTDPAGLAYRYDYDASGNLTEITDPLGHTNRFAYGALNRMTQLTDANGNATQYAYDSSGNLNGITYADTSAESWTHDNEGNPDSWTNRRSSSLTYEYDADGRLTAKVYPDLSRVEYKYEDGRGNLTSFIDATGTTTLTYDANDRLERITDPDGRWLEYTYNTAGQRDSMLNQLGHRLDYFYDAAGRLESISDEAVTEIVRYHYDPVGRLERKDLQNGVYTLYGYDDASQLTSLVNYKPDDSVLSTFTYTYDERGRRKTMTTLEGLWTYEYDATGQLTEWTAPDGQNVVYEYDAMGNRAKVTDDGVETLYTVNDLNQYTQVGTTSYTYDLDGNIYQRINGSNTQTFTYDEEDRLLLSVDTTPAHTLSRVYNAVGFRVGTVEDGVEAEFTIDPIGWGNLVGRFDGVSGNLVATYDHGAGLVARNDSVGISSTYTFDGLGNTIETTDVASAVVGNSYSYDPMGELRSSSTTHPNSFEFSGEYGVETTTDQLSYMRARSYDAQIGRFLSEDPIGLNGGDANLYTYAFNQPTGFVDPDGRQALQLIIRCGASLYVTIKTLEVVIDIAQTAERINRPIYSPGLGIGDSLSCDSECQARRYEWQYNCAGEACACRYDRRQRLVPPRELPDPPMCLAGQPMCYPQETESPFAVDPNEKTGSIGHGQLQWVDGNSLLSYRVDFENDAIATAPAQIVTITDQLQSDLDWPTFALSEIGFGDVVIDVPNGLQHHEGIVPFEYNGTDFEVWHEVGLSQNTGEIYANFYSIDPQTGLPPAVDIGFLPPEDGTGRGQGHFTYVIKPLPGLTPGTEIRNIANITFDFGETIATNQIDPHDPSAGTDPDKEALNTIAAETAWVMLSSTAGGSVVGPGEGSFEYDFAETVALAAVPDAGYDFAGWSGTIEGVADPNSSSTELIAYTDFAIQAVFAETPLPMVPSLNKLGLIAFCVTLLAVAARAQSKSKRSRDS